MTPQRERLWMAIGGVAALAAAFLAFLDAAWSRAALAAEMALLVFGAYLLLSRKIERVRGSLLPLKTQTGQTAREIRQMRREVARIRPSITKLQAAQDKVRDAQDKRIAMAVQQISELFKAQLSHEAAGIKTVVKDAEIESGLAALNRYTSLAERRPDPEGSASDA